jgi:geranylgeranyl pyrophosphate synthase
MKIIEVAFNDKNIIFSLFLIKYNLFTLLNKFIKMKKFCSKAVQAKYAMPGGLSKYKQLVDKSHSIAEELFPKQIVNRNDLNKYLRLQNISRNIRNDCNQGSESITHGILKPCWDLIDRGGKKWRPMFGLMIADYFNVNIHDNHSSKNKMIYQALELTELFHNATLIIDDIEDKSENRRGKKCVHLIYGEDLSINAGISLLYFPMYYFITQIQDISLKAELCQAYFEEMSALHLGQNWDIEMKIGRRIPTENNYKDIVMCKTGVMPRFIVKLMQGFINHLFSENKINEKIFSEFIDIADNLSVAFQIKDDLLNLVPSELSKGKGIIGEDLFEGKMTLMVLHTLNNKNGKNKQRLEEILTMKSKEQKILNEGIEILKSNGSIHYATQVMEMHHDIVREKCKKLSQFNEIGNLKLNKEAALRVSELVDYLVERNL